MHGATARMIAAGAWPTRYTFSPAMRAGNLLFLAGTTAADETGAIVAPGDIVGQTRYIYQKFAALLAAAGAGLEHVVETTEYITTTENYRGTADVRREVFRPPYPVATGVIVKGLLREGALIEISAVAVLPEVDGHQGAIEKRLFNFGVPWEKDISFSQGASVRGGRLVLLSGQAAIDDAGRVIGTGDMAAQVRAALDAVGRGLALAGATPADVVKVVYYTTDCRAFHKTQPIREAFFPRPFPAQTLVEVTRLAMRDFLVEADVTAVVRD